MITKKQVAFLESLVDVYPDYPKEGVSFKDLSPVYTDPYAMSMICDYMTDALKHDMPDCIIGCDARGFILGTMLAQKLHLPLVLARKPGKLPGNILAQKYDLEYGTAELNMHEHIISQYRKPLVADDVLATGGTVIAVAEMLRKINIDVHGFAFISEVKVCGGHQKINDKYHPRFILSVIKS